MPVAGAGCSRSKGLEVKIASQRNPAPSAPCTERARALNLAGRSRAKSASAAPKNARISTQRSSEPSWLPQVAAKRKKTGISALECAATRRTEKSETRKDRASAAKAMSIRSACPTAAKSATSIRRRSDRQRPTCGTTACATATTIATIIAKRPISAVMGLISPCGACCSARSGTALPPRFIRCEHTRDWSVD